MNQPQPIISDEEAELKRKRGMIVLFKIAVGCDDDPQALEMAEAYPLLVMEKRWDSMSYLVRRSLCEIMGLPQHVDKTQWFFFTIEQQDIICRKIQNRAARIRQIEAKHGVIALDGQDQPAWGRAA